MKNCEFLNCTNKYHARGYCRTHCNELLLEQGRIRVFHGLSRADEYNIWCGIKARCFNKSDTGYSYYGGRGVTMDEKWEKSFLAFYKDVGLRPSKKHSLDRIDNDGHYAPGNVRWVTHSEQMHNTRKHKDNTSGYKGVTWSKERKKWQAQIGLDSKVINLGRYSTLNEAVEARQKAEYSLFGVLI